MNLKRQLASASETQARLALSNLLHGLADLGFGTEEPINGADAVESIATLFEDTVGRCLATPTPNEATAARTG